MSIEEIDTKINLIFNDFINFSDENISETPYLYFSNLAFFLKDECSYLSKEKITLLNNVFTDFLLVKYKVWDIENILYVGFLEVLSDNIIVFT